MIETDGDPYPADKASNTSIVCIDSWAHEAGADLTVAFLGSLINMRARAEMFPT